MILYRKYTSWCASFDDLYQSQGHTSFYKIPLPINFYSSLCILDLLDEAQAFVLDKLEREVHPKFLHSRDGQQFLEALVTRDINRRSQQR